MIKIVFAVVAAIAISFASCGNKTQQAVTPDSAANSPQALVELIDDDIAEISELVEKKDTAQLKTALNDMKGSSTSRRTARISKPSLATTRLSMPR